jgi:hypothetical protein
MTAAMQHLAALAVMSAEGQATERPALAADLTLYHLVHPVNARLDEWTHDYRRALTICARFIRDYGGVHLHVETHCAGQYDAKCLLRTGVEETR